MKKVSIAMYSTVKGGGWKSNQIELITSNPLSNFVYYKYGIKRRKEAQLKNEYLSYIPMFLSGVYYKYSDIFKTRRYLGYLLGEKAFGHIFSKRVADDDSNIVFCKGRPLNIIKNCNNVGKKIVMEYSEVHPEFMKDKLNIEYNMFDIPSQLQYIYTDSGAIDEANEAIRHADKILVLSEFSKKTFIENGVDEQRLNVINLPISKNRKPQRINVNENEKFTFISTAFHSFVKGTHRLLLAWRQANLDSSKLLIVGPINSDLEQFIQREGPFKNVEFTGQVDVKDLYANVSNPIGVSLSFAEGFSRATLEYIESGFPVIISPVCTLDLLEDREEGFIVEPTDQKQIIEAMKEITTREKYEMFSYNISRSTKLAKISEGEYLDKLESIFNEVLNES